MVHRLHTPEAIAARSKPRLNPIEKAQLNPTSLRCAINAKCFDCQGADADVGVRKRIGDCPSQTCPLFPVRPYQKSEDDED
jgi:hypothetical protein